jgi:hypothetical protein
MRIQDPGWKKFESGINIPNPQHWVPCGRLTDGDDIPVGLPLQLILDTPLAAEGDVHVFRLLVRLPVVHKLNKSGQYNK